MTEPPKDWEDRTKDMDPFLQELIMYEASSLPFISCHPSFMPSFVHLIYGKYIAWKVRRKYRNYIRAKNDRSTIHVA